QCLPLRFQYQMSFAFPAPFTLYQDTLHRLEVFVSSWEHHISLQDKEHESFPSCIFRHLLPLVLIWLKHLRVCLVVRIIHQAGKNLREEVRECPTSFIARAGPEDASSYVR